MHSDFQRLVLGATRLVRAGDLRDATAAIQAALGGTTGHPGASSRPAAPAGTVFDVEAREIVAPELPGGMRKDLEAPERHPAAGTFIAARGGDGRMQRDYKLYVPPQAGARALPLLVMLHGCTQSPDDFAVGTRMNEEAARHGFFVLYPAQSQQANPQRCWNWFKHSHQERGRGEPAMLAAMSRKVMAEHGIDSARVYVAGLSAGGAMAAILGATYPDLYAAIGVHSGLAAGAASDLPSALAVMRTGSGACSGNPARTPAIVFHGDADRTVHPDNARRIVDAVAGESAHARSDQTQRSGSRKGFTRHVYRSGQDEVLAEHWVIHGGGHAWFGGCPDGSYTDPAGPDATAQMLRFFLTHPRLRHEPDSSATAI